jgi:AraC family transcriptional regulator, transcriptional activator of the genes for pyochelin and ferripyochelin receptors
MEIISGQEYYDRWIDSAVRDEVSGERSGFDLASSCSTIWSEDHYREVQLRPGLSLDICDEVYHRDLGVKCEHEEFTVLVSKFYLSGYHHVISPTGIVDVAPNYIEQGGYHYLFYLPNIEEMDRSFAGTQTRLVRIEVDLTLLKSFFRSMDSIPQLLRPLLENNPNAPQFHSPIGRITVEMQQLIQQIWQTPYQGVVGRMYLESKALELIALQIDRLLANEQGKAILPSLDPIEIDRIHQAKEILLHNHIAPPSLMELSQQVGLYHMKLKQGFQEVFGTTPFGYLREHRLELALRLLRDDRALSVGTVAERVGYASQGRFANAFKRKFGITPSECRTGKLPTSSGH